MTKKTIKLYVNDPMGRRCEMNMQAALKAINNLGVELVIIKNGSDEYLMEGNPPQCPSVAVDNRLIIENGTIEYEQLRAEILKDA